MNVRIRGIYATALTGLLTDDGHQVVQASPAIRDRFDADFPVADEDASVETTADRQGVTLEGDPDAVATLAERLAGVGLDAFAWASPAARGAVFDGYVSDTSGTGATVDLGETVGYLPYHNADDYVDAGDAVRVQVCEAHPPWDRDEPVLDTDLVVPGGLVDLVRGSGPDVTVAGGEGAPGRELVGLTGLLDVDVPDGWRVRWRREATDAEMTALRAALSRTVGRAEVIEQTLDEPVADEPRRLAAPLAVRHVWFGRECRDALDAIRRDVTTTMPGHHRTKAASSAASAGVDLAEALCEPSGEFPFDVVTRQFGPVEGDAVRIGHGKPDGRLIVLGEGEVVARDPDGTVEVVREMTPGGTYDALDAERAAGDTATTKFREGRWWYPTVYRDEDGQRKGTYVNVCTPVEVFPEVVRYVDLHVDVVKHRDGRVERVDDDDLDASVAAGEISDPLAEKARSVATSIERALGR
ncbi:MAG: DUF402 domain-containing protein [Haloferacaceae archaeon]